MVAAAPVPDFSDGSSGPPAHLSDAELASALARPRSGHCYVAANQSTLPPYYRSNIYHQSEFVWPMVETAMASLAPPSHVLWTSRMMEWSASVFSLLLPNTTLVAPRAAITAMRCRQELCPHGRRVRFRAVGPTGGKRGYFASPSTPPRVRALVMRACGLPQPTVGPRLRVVHLVRYVAAGRNTSARAGRRQMIDEEEVHATIRALAPDAELVVRTSPAGGSVCEQVRWLDGVGVVLTAHGSQLNNLVFAPPGLLLLEVLPWGLAGYPGHRAMLRYSGIRHVQLGSMRPPAHESGPFANVSRERDCTPQSGCLGWHRDRANIYVNASELGAVLERELPAVRAAARGATDGHGSAGAARR